MFDVSDALFPAFKKLRPIVAGLQGAGAHPGGAALIEPWGELKTGPGQSRAREPHGNGVVFARRIHLRNAGQTHPPRGVIQSVVVMTFETGWLAEAACLCRVRPIAECEERKRTEQD